MHKRAVEFIVLLTKELHDKTSNDQYKKDLYEAIGALQHLLKYW